MIAVLLAMVAVPVGVSASSTTAERLTTAAEEYRAEHERRPAVLLEPAVGKVTAANGWVPATATWTVGFGPPREGTVYAPVGSRPGDTVEVWMTRSGEPVAPPPRPRDITGRAVVQGVFTALGVMAAAVVAHLLVCLLLDRIRMLQWGGEWSTVEPRWSDRRP
ncbi:hypothetical protein OF117_00760 [Geodermatophilus sp. YIM 151500]|uniref:Rv1733c family protein n=1 Tax=Geodermatophilus sp. YIM 151500 TaxID=2984531 RepID=UPI0021E3B91A|nr:hypothetical protein [Geodermatophilus sp. YIM 151500]MCV2487877.1 hypothetical protein [Geodermatophilus sp. YIM 151500]